MAPTRPPRGSRRAPAGPAWDQVDLAPVVLIRAGEEILADRAVARLLDQARRKDASTEISTVEAAAYEPHQLDTFVSPSLFGEPKLVLVPDLERMTDALASDLLAYTAAPDPDVVLLLRHNGGRRGKKLLDSLARSPHPVVTIDAVKSPKDKAALVSADVRRAGRRIEPQAVGALVDALGSDLRELCSAVEQLIADTRGTITLAAVNTYYAGRFEATGFTVSRWALSKSVGRRLSKNGSTAHTLLPARRQSKPDEPTTEAQKSAASRSSPLTEGIEMRRERSRTASSRWLSEGFIAQK